VKPNKLLIIGPGNAIHTKKWIKYFSDNGWEVYWFGYNNELNDYRKYIREIFELNYGLTIIEIIIKFRTIIAKIRPDIINLHYFQSYQICSIFGGGIPIILCGWGNDILIDPFNCARHKKLLGIVCGKSAKIISIAAHMTDILINTVKVSKEKIVTTFWGYDSNIFYKNNAIEKDRNLVRVIIPRGFCAVYNWRTVMSAIPIIINTNPKYKFIFCNGGDEEIVARTIIEEQGIGEYVEIFGRLTQEELANEFNKSDIYLSMSVSDGNLISLNEAMACGVYPICSDTVATRQWIAPGKNGLLMNDNFDYKELAEKILALNPDSREIKNAITYNIEYMRNTADFAMNLKNIEKIFFQCLQK